MVKSEREDENEKDNLFQQSLVSRSCCFPWLELPRTGVAVATEAEDTAVVSAAEDTRALVAAAMSAELVMATVELELAMVLAAMARGIIHPEYQRDATAATAATGKGITHREPRRGIQIYRSSPSSQSRTASRQFARSPKYSGSYYVPRDQSTTGFARKPGIQQRAGTTAKGATRPDRAWSRQNAANRQRLDPQTTQRLRNWQGKAPGYERRKTSSPGTLARSQAP